MQRVKELDSIRGLASLAIVIYHLWLSNIGLLGAAVDLFFATTRNTARNAKIPGQKARILSCMSGCCFFVLSGFLITLILFTHVMSHHFLVLFYTRRALRIWPMYYLPLSILVLLNPFMPGPGSLKSLKDRFGYQRDAAPAGFGEGRKLVPRVTAPAGLDDAFKLAPSLTLAKASTAKARW